MASFSDILALASSIHQLSVGSRRVRCSMWSALQATVLFATDPKTAAGETEIEDKEILKPKKQDEGEMGEDKVQRDKVMKEEEDAGPVPAAINNEDWMAGLSQDDDEKTTDGAEKSGGEEGLVKQEAQEERAL